MYRICIEDPRCRLASAMKTQQLRVHRLPGAQGPSFGDASDFLVILLVIQILQYLQDPKLWE